jgi:nucleotide-binding universal stress UspA family protein
VTNSTPASTETEPKRIGEAGGTVTRFHLRQGRTTDELIKLGDELEVGLVVGSGGHGGVKHILLGSHSEGIIHHAHRPVLVVRGGESVWPTARIVAGDAFSEGAKKAAKLATNPAANLEHLFGAQMLLHTRPYLPAASGEAVQQSEKQLENRAGELEGILEEGPQTGAVAGDATQALPGAEREHERSTLVPVGSRGSGVVQRVRLGSVSTNVVTTGLGVVLVSPHSDEQSTAREEQTPTDSQTTEEVAATRGESTRRRASDG